MSIFGKSNRVSNELNVPAYEGYVQPDLSGIQMISMEATEDFFKLGGSLYITDSIIEESVLEGANIQPVLENVFKDGFAKIKAIFVKLWKKIKAWFDAVIRRFKIFFTNGEKFISKFKNEIESKTAKGFTYKGYKYTLDKGETEVNRVDGAIHEWLVENLQWDDKHTTAKQQHTSITIGDRQESYDTDSDKDALLKKALGTDDKSEGLKILADEFRNKQETEEEFEDFSGNSRAELIKFVQDGSKTISKIQAHENKTKDKFDRIMKAISTAENNISKEKESDNSNKASHTAFAQHKFSMAQFAIGIITDAIGVQKQAVEEAAKRSEKVLKSFLTYKPAKDSYSFSDDSDNSSILESAMRML